jgi:hypothetical protein
MIKNYHQRKPTGSDEIPNRYWCACDYQELIVSGKVSQDIFWLNNESHERFPKPLLPRD